MKKAIFVSFAFVLVLTTTYLLAQKSTLSIADRWKKVEAYAQKELPESALKEIDIILKQAQKEHRQDEVIKAMVCKMRFTLDKDPDKAPELIREFEAFTLQTTDPATRALLHSMTGELYANYYNRDSWTINQRTEIKGAAPEDMKEWTRNMYVDKVLDHLQKSIVPQKVLTKTSPDKIRVLLSRGKDSPKIEPSLYEFLLHRKVQILRDLNPEENSAKLLNTEYLGSITSFLKMKDDSEATRIESEIAIGYRQLIRSMQEKNLTTGLVIFNLERLEFFRSKLNHENMDSLHLASLQAFNKDYVNQEISVEILAEIASSYIDQSTKDPDIFFRYDRTRLQPENPAMLDFKEKALSVCNDGIKKFPHYSRIGILKNIRNELLVPQLLVRSEGITDSKSDLVVTILSQNIPSVVFKVYRINATADQYYQANMDQSRFKKTLISSEQIAVKNFKQFVSFSTKKDIHVPDYGIYQYTVESATNKLKTQIATGRFVVTDLSCIVRRNTEGKTNLYVLDRLTGHPVKDVKVNCVDRYFARNIYRSDTVAHLISATDGSCSYIYNSMRYSSPTYILKKGKDSYFRSDISTYFAPNIEDESVKSQVDFMTDRAIYRPGQTIQFKLIAYNLQKEKKEVIRKSTYQVILRDANGKEIASKSVLTNEFGSAAGTFSLPESCMPGSFTLSTANSSYSFRVEEYKRPSFEVILDKPKDEIAFGAKAEVKGNVKAYAGYAIANAQVKYRIVRKSHLFCWWIPRSEEQEASGVITTDGNGVFAIPFQPQKLKNKGSEVYTYTFYADVTDIKGETQQAEMNLSVGDQALFIITQVPGKVDKEKVFEAEVSAQTINDEKVNAAISYKLFSLEDTEEFMENLPEKPVFKTGKLLLEGTVNAGDKSVLLHLNKFNSGRYRLVFETKDKNGKPVTTENTFVLYSKTDKLPPVKAYKWGYAENTICNYGDTATIVFGTSVTDAKVLYEVMKGNTIIESRWIDFSNDVKTFRIPFLKNYGSGVNVSFTYLRNGKLYTERTSLMHKPEIRSLDVKLSTFRNKLLPGEKTTWTVNVASKEKTKLSAEVLASMYDASLDLFGKNVWNFEPVYHETFWYSPQWQTSYDNEIFADVYYGVDQIIVLDYDVNSLKWFGMSLGSMNSYRRLGARASVKFTAPVLKSDEESMDETVRRTRRIFSISDVKGNDEVNGKDIADVKADVVQMLQGKVAGVAVGYAAKRQVLETITPRTNFNETAFFYPQLQTDSAGNVQFSFTAPESLTRWNVKMLAHTQDLYFGQAEAQVVTQKELMVQMNLPRFVRRSDKLTLSANVVNLSDKAQTADVAFQLIDPATNQPIVLKNAPAQQVTLAANETKVVSWEVSEFSPYELVVCKVVASSEQFSDGEQKYLPVLPDKVLLTESMPLIIRGGQSRDFRFESLMKNAAKVETKNLAVEFSANPAWYAVQALPTISEPNDDNAISLFTAYYANTLAGWVANSSPKISAMFDRWKNEGGSREALLSNLQKNAELKNMLLEETPWVMAAQNETEQKRQIALLFDLNNQKNKSDQYWDKLQKLQLPSGGFAWFAGMPESRYTTLEILLNWARLQRMTKSALPGDDARLSSITHALEYLDLEIAHDFSELKKYNKNYVKEDCLSDEQLFYLHTRSEYSQIPLHESAKEAVKFYTAQAEKYWHDCTLYGKAMMAVTFNRNGNKKLAVEILNSLKENALKTDEMGMYWARNASGYFWNERPIAVQAAIINAFTELEPGSAAIDELKIWLLKQKQTQSWDNPLASVNAIYALLNNGSNWLSNESTTIVKVDGKELKPATKEAGTGYFKQTISTANMTASQLADLSKVKVISTVGKNSSVGWGAMYWQFYQNQEEVEAQGGALKVSKSLYVLKSEGTTKEMIPASQTTLHKGDKVITRLVVTTDRNLEYVALKDLCAACFEPVNQLSGYQWKEGVGYYQTSKDASTQFFFSYLPKGTYVFEYELWVNNSGTFTSGITSLQCQYAPEFVSHSGGERIVVK